MTHEMAKPTSTSRWPAVLGRLFLVLLAVLVWLNDLADQGFAYSDDSRHAMGGALILDFVTEGGWRNPVDYGTRYYARYPCLSIPFYSPPLFHGVLAIFYGLFGVSTVTALHAVLFFHVAGVIALFEISRRVMGAGAAFLAGALFTLSPVVAYWNHFVALEPAATSMGLVASLLLLRFDEKPSGGRGLAWAVAIVATLLTKQTTIFLLVGHLAFLATRPTARRGLTAGLIGALALAIVGYGVFWWLWSPFQMEGFRTSWDSFEHWWGKATYFPRSLPDLIGGVVTTLSVAGMLLRLFRRPDRVDTLFLCWMLGFFAMTLVLDRQGARYAYVWIPPWAYFAARFVADVGALIRAPRLALLAGFAPIVVGLDWTLNSDIPRVTGYERAAELVAKLPGDGPVLFDGYWDGDFIFFSRAHDPRRRMILRGSKVLYTFASFRWKNYEALVEGPEAIREFLKKHGVRYIVVEDKDVIDAPPSHDLRRLLATSGFRRLYRVKVTASPMTRITANNLDIYENLDAGPPSGEPLELRFPGLNRTVTVPVPVRPTP